MISNIKNFMVNSYRTDVLAFWCEMIGSFAAIIASAMLAIYAQDPPMLLIYPFYLTSSLLHVVASVRRNAAWIAILSVYFTFINIYGILNLTVF
jgi:hypothetical protein